ncbi:hypothetical protein [Jidongwangia harbinensis]|uniref:hypothetical protein n=1 Tax=Jidongwangia harbinensis TaxID=2878561 RepID=UPI001CDA10D6|nr:hypothetical protein [Jidongwangia harbinensis]MCA2215465.1 hypothetical protein [Jidongwangia harbinensis]
MSANPDTRPVHVELHDARLAAAATTFHLGGAVVLQIAHLVTYHEIEPERFALYSRAAELTFLGCRAAHLDGVLSDPSVVSEAHLLLGTDEQPLWKCLEDCSATAFTLVTTAGAQLALHITGARLRLANPHRRLKDFEGPLVARPE